MVLIKLCNKRYDICCGITEGNNDIEVLREVLRYLLRCGDTEPGTRKDDPKNYGGVEPNRYSTYAIVTQYKDNREDDKQRGLNGLDDFIAHSKSYLEGLDFFMAREIPIRSESMLEDKTEDKRNLPPELKKKLAIAHHERQYINFLESKGIEVEKDMKEKSLDAMDEVADEIKRLVKQGATYVENFINGMVCIVYIRLILILQ